MLGLYGDNRKENGNYYLGFRQILSKVARPVSTSQMLLPIGGPVGK